MFSSSFFPPLKLELETIPHIIIESSFTRENWIPNDIWGFFYGFPSGLLASLFLFSLLFWSFLYKMKGIRAEMRDHSPYLKLNSMTIISVQPRALTKDKSFCVTQNSLNWTINRCNIFLGRHTHNHTLLPPQYGTLLHQLWTLLKGYKSPVKAQ